MQQCRYVGIKITVGILRKGITISTEIFLINKAPNKCFLYYNLLYVFRYLIVLCDYHCHLSNLEVILLQKL